MKVKIGDWVRSYSSGIWQVYRIVENLEEFDSISKSVEKRSLVFCKRFLNNSFKRSFGSESCHPDFVYGLEKADHEKLLSIINDNPDLFSKFQKYKPKPIDAIYNLSFCVDANSKVSDYQGIFDESEPLDVFEIRAKAESNNLKLRSVPDLTNEEVRWTLQFCSEDHKIVNNRLIYKFTRVLEF